MHKEAINKKIEKVIAKISKIEEIEEFYLAGGTALSLQFGHRKSIDLDFFSNKKVNLEQIKKALLKANKVFLISEDKETLHLFFEGVRLSFFLYPYKLLFPLMEWDGIKVADWRDIACMKLAAVSSRGSKKDFVDLYFILQKVSLKRLLSLFEKKYKNLEVNKLHILKSLNYFVEAKREPMPKMIKKISWQEVEKFFKDLTKKEVSRL